jgi:glycosyltransferase involved in cell wall biosynthesis
LLSCDRVLLVSDWMRDTLAAELAAVGGGAAREFAERARVVGVPIDTAAIDEARLRARREARDHRRVIFNHSMSAGKRPELFLTFASRLLEADPDVLVHMTRGAGGCPSLRREIGRLAGEFGPRFVVHDTLSIPDYYDLLAGSDLQVSTASHESFGIATVEAMYAGLACLAPSWGAYPEVMRSDSASLYQPDASDLLDRARAFLGDTDLRSQVGHRLREAASRFSPARIAGRVAAVLRE